MNTLTLFRAAAFGLPLALGAAAFGQQYATCSAAAAGSATAVPGGTYNGNTAAATSTNINLSCDGDGASRCVWFRFLSPQTGYIHLSMCGSSFDTLLSVHAGACPGASATSAPCNDDSCGTQSELDFSATAGTVYLVRVAGYGGDTGAFTLNFSNYQAPPPPPTPGPDVTVWAITDLLAYTSGTNTAYAVGTTSFNPGSMPVDWRDSGTNNKSPVIAQNIYKLKNGRFTQLGQGWLKHGFLSTNSPGQGCITPPLGGDQLGINCLDTYDAGLNGSQNYLGPRSVVNATSGYFPPTGNGGFATSADPAFKLAQCPTSAFEAGSTYFAEGYYCTYDDACWGNSLNNASYTNIVGATAGSTGIGATVKRQNAIRAWGVADPSVVTVNADHTYTLITFGAQGDANTAYPTLPRDNTCRYIVAAKVTDNGNGTWHYEYAVYNHNSDRSGYSFSVRTPANAQVTNEGVWFPRSHSGEPYTNGNWITDKLPGSLTFRADAAYATNANANAIRWGTMYTFWFDANVPPATGQGKIALFKPAYQGSHPSAAGPSGRVANDLAQFAFANGLPVPRFCIADVATLGGNPGPDGQLTADDIVGYLAAFFANDLAIADLASLGGAGFPDGQVTTDDLVYVLAAFFAGTNCN